MRATAPLLLAVLIAPADARPCGGAMPARVIKTSAGQISATGGVIVASGQSTMPDWRFREINRSLRAQIVPIAPGLAIYHAPPLPTTLAVLETSDHAVVVNVTRVSNIGERLAAPSPMSIAFAPITGGRTGVFAAFEGSWPERAVVAILSRVVGKRRIPMLWAATGGDRAARVLLWQTPWSCQETIEGTRAPKVGDRVVLTWIDAAGRLSEPSKPILIGGGT